MANQKKLAIEMQKMYNLPDGSAEKYAILAYFKEQEKVKNDLTNAMVESKITPAVQNCNTTINKGLSINPHIERWLNKQEFTLTHLLLCVVAFLLFVGLIIQE